VAGAGGAVGGLLGGILTGWISWRWIFFINVPLGIVAVVGSFLYLHELRNKDALVKLDVVGAALVTASLAAIIYAVVESPKVGWTSNTTIAWLCGGLAGLVAFVGWELKVASHPLVPFRIFKSRSILGADLVMLCVGGAFFAMWYFLTYYFQFVHGYSAVRAGFAFLPMALGIITGAQISSRIVAKTGVRPILFVGTLMATLGFLWMSRLSVHGSYAAVVVGPAVTCALAMGLLFTPLAAAATSGVDRADSGLASGVLNASRQIGGSLALAILATLAANRANEFHAAAFGAVAQTAGYQRAFLVSAGVTATAFALSFLVPASTGQRATH
jgi:EmrB/QacA subfamily drug resistance transporter